MHHTGTKGKRRKDQCYYILIFLFCKLKTNPFILSQTPSLCIDKISVTSCAFPSQIIQLVEGKASAYVFASPGCKKWDTCATEAILHAVGGNTSFLSVYWFILFYFLLLQCTKPWCVTNHLLLPQRKADRHARELLPVRRRREAHELCWCACHDEGSSVLRQQSSPVRPQGPAVWLNSHSLMDFIPFNWNH